MPIDPETNEVVDDISRSRGIALAEIKAERDHRRAVADIVTTQSDKAWLRGWLHGFVTGVVIVRIVVWTWVYIIQSLFE